MGYRSEAIQNYIILKRDVVKVIGDRPAIVLAELINQETYLIRTNKITEGDSFFYKDSYFMGKLGYTRPLLNRQLKKLETYGLIKISHNVKNQREYTLQEEAINSLYSGDFSVTKRYTKLEEKKILAYQNVTPLKRILDNSCFLGKNTSNNSYFLDENTSGNPPHGDISAREFSSVCSENTEPVELFDTSLPENIKNIQPENPIITFWNKFDCFSKHSSRNTKLYKNASIYLNKLLDHTFCNSYEFDSTWKIENNLKTSILKNITEKDIKSAIVAYSLQFQPDYLPENKDRLPRSITDFIYNPRTKKSQLLWLLQKPPKLVDSPNVEVFKKRLPASVVQRINTMLAYKHPNMSERHVSEVYVNAGNTLKRMTALCTTMPEYNASPSTFITHLGKGEQHMPFERLWLDFLDKKPAITAYDFSPDSYTFTNFLDYVSREFQLDLDDSPEHLSSMKKPEKVVRSTVKAKSSMDALLEQFE